MNNTIQLNLRREDTDTPEFVVDITYSYLDYLLGSMTGGITRLEANVPRKEIEGTYHLRVYESEPRKTLEPVDMPGFFTVAATPLGGGVRLTFRYYQPGAGVEWVGRMFHE